MLYDFPLKMPHGWGSRRARTYKSIFKTCLTIYLPR